MQDNAIERLLDQMHAAILVSDFKTMNEVAPDLEKALADLRAPDAALLQRITGKAQRNAACLKAAGRGVRAALRRLTEVRQNAAGLVTYDGTGKRAKLSMPGKLARRF
jgi:hypothetical protein